MMGIGRVFLGLVLVFLYAPVAFFFFIDFFVCL